MNKPQHHTDPSPTVWQDPIVQELHALRAKMVAQYKGDIRSYTKACVANTQALGFRFKTLNDVKGAPPIK